MQINYDYIGWVNYYLGEFSCFDVEKMAKVLKYQNAYW